MPPAPVVPVEDGGNGGGAGKEDACHVGWSAWCSHVRCLLGLPCRAAFGLCPAAPISSPATVSGTLFLPSRGDRCVRLFLHEHAESPAPFLVLHLPAGLGGTDVATAGRIVLEHRQEWSTGAAAGSGALLESPKWLVYYNGRQIQGFVVRREEPSDAEGWVLDKLWAVTAGAGRLPGGAVEYLRGRFERVVGSSDAESFHLVEPVGWRQVNSGGGGLSIFFHRI